MSALLLHAAASTRVSSDRMAGVPERKSLFEVDGYPQRLRAELGEQRSAIEWLEAEPSRDLLIRGARALFEELA